MPLDYILPPLYQVRSFLAELPSAGELPPKAFPAARTTLYIWGYGQPRFPLPWLPFRCTEAAARFATEHGWDEDLWSAWVVEAELSCPLSAVVREYGPRLQLERTVTGWGVRMARDRPSSRRVS